MVAENEARALVEQFFQELKSHGSGDAVGLSQRQKRNKITFVNEKSLIVEVGCI